MIWGYGSWGKSERNAVCIVVESKCNEVQLTLVWEKKNDKSRSKGNQESALEVFDAQEKQCTVRLSETVGAHSRTRSGQSKRGAQESSVKMDVIYKLISKWRQNNTHTSNRYKNFTVRSTLAHIRTSAQREGPDFGSDRFRCEVVGKTGQF